MNEATAPVVDAAPNGTDLTALENARRWATNLLPGEGFGTAVATYTGNPATRPGARARTVILRIAAGKWPG